MYNRIEDDFKKKSGFTQDTIFIVIVYILFIACSVALTLLLEKVLYSYILFLFLFFVVYFYMYKMIKKLDSSEKIPFWNFKTNISIYKKLRRKNSIDKLVIICEENHINTRPKVQEALRHYQVLMPRNIIGSGVFISLFALVISIAAFAYTENGAISVLKLQFIGSIFLLVTLLYLFSKTIIEPLISNFGRKAIIQRMESLLSIIFFQSLIK